MFGTALTLRHRLPQKALSPGRLLQMSRVAMAAGPSRCTTGGAGCVWASWLTVPGSVGKSIRQPRPLRQSSRSCRPEPAGPGRQPASRSDRPDDPVDTLSAPSWRHRAVSAPPMAVMTVAGALAGCEPRSAMNSWRCLPTRLRPALPANGEFSCDGLRADCSFDRVVVDLRYGCGLAQEALEDCTTGYEAQRRGEFGLRDFEAQKAARP